ncbi:hypothetical protein JCM6882_000833 [Rhodosporidiobolus microsporus]
MTTSAALYPCTVCNRSTALVCGGPSTPCEAFFCSREHQKLLWPTHRWLCGKPSSTFSFAPLTEEEAHALEILAQPTSHPEGFKVYWPALVKELQLWDGKDEPKTLLADLRQREPSTVAEPLRSLLIGELRGILVRAIPLLPSLGLDSASANAWTLTGALLRRLHNAIPLGLQIHFLQARDPSALEQFAPVLRAFLAFHTIRLSREKLLKDAAATRSSAPPLADLDEILALAHSRVLPSADTVTGLQMFPGSDNVSKKEGMDNLKQDVKTALDMYERGIPMDGYATTLDGSLTMPLYSREDLERMKALHNVLERR